MRRIWIGVGLVAALCVFSTVAASALAETHKKTHTKPPKVLGKFVANFPHGPKITPASPVTAKGVGSVELIKLVGKEGWLIIGGGRRSTGCKKVKSSGGVDWERSDTFFELVKFSGCRAAIGEGTIKEVPKVSNFKIGFEFHSNGFIESGGGEATSVHVNKTAVFIKRKGGLCTVEIPAQTVPIKATKKPENEFEAATYETEMEPANIKKFPKGFQEKLDIDVELKKVIAHVNKAKYCLVGTYKDNLGVINIELEEVEIKNGNLGFRDKAEVEAEEKAAKEAAEKQSGREATPEEKAEQEQAEKEKVEAEEQQEKEKAEKVEEEENEKAEKQEEEE
jgi:hypothetical protein